MTRRVYVSEIEGRNVRGRPPMKWRDKVQEYVRERGEGSLRNLEQARGQCQDGERWKLFCCGHPLVGAPRSRHQNDLIESSFFCSDLGVWMFLKKVHKSRFFKLI